MGGCCPCVLALAASSRPLAQGLSCNRTPLCKGPWPQSADPLQVARSWLATPVGGLAVASHPCKWLSHGRLPLVRITFAVKTQQEDLAEVQHREVEALEKMKALEKEFQGLKKDLDAGRAKNREMEDFLSITGDAKKGREGPCL
ncbi:hypothetical protein GW17_00039192 [Ensete ventricosum]|nr:hypothetical protein GW17_00039192 [Ensete ventricosum]